jgi:signal transduction histidine kinase
MPRLYQKIYLTIVAALIAVVLVAGGLWRLGARGPAGQGAEFAAEFAAGALPDASRPPAEQQRAIAALSARLRSDITLFDADRQPIAVAGRPAPVPRPRAEPFGMVHDADGPAWSLQLPDGRWLVARLPPRHGNPLLGLVLFLAAVAGVVALCAFPVVRGLTRRIERLREGVDTLAAGNLAARVPVEGKDEVAELARGFNHAAARIEELVAAHRMLLANASHELRTPLARIRMGLELMGTDDNPKYRASIETDLRELEDLIEGLLTSSRLDAMTALAERAPIDLLALAAEEAARIPGCAAEGEAMIVSGDARLLRRLVRNLLENATRHGKPPVLARVSATADMVRLDVTDHGAGVAAADRERVFEPFFQARRDSPGVGLGLALVRRIARLHGGEARVVDAPDGGFCLRVELARAPVAARN